MGHEVLEADGEYEVVLAVVDAGGVELRRYEAGGRRLRELLLAAQDPGVHVVDVSPAGGRWGGGGA